MFSIPIEIPSDWMEVVLLPSIALFFGLLVFLLGEFNVGEAGRPKKWRWVGAAILLIGALLGFRFFLPMVSNSVEANIYRGNLQGMGRRILLSHWFAFCGPFLSFWICVLISWRHGKRLTEFHDQL